MGNERLHMIYRIKRIIQAWGMKVRRWFWICLFNNRWITVWQFLLFSFLPLRSDPLRDKKNLRQVGFESSTCCPESLCNAGSCESCLCVLFPTDDCRIKHPSSYHINMLLISWYGSFYSKHMSYALQKHQPDWFLPHLRQRCWQLQQQCPGYRMNYVISTRADECVKDGKW